MKASSNEATIRYLRDELRRSRMLSVQLLVDKVDLLAGKLALAKRVGELAGLLARRDILLTETEKELAEYQSEFSDAADVGIDTGPPPASRYGAGGVKEGDDK